MLLDQSRWAVTDAALCPDLGARSFFSRPLQLPEFVCVCLVHFERLRVSPTKSPIETGTFLFCRLGCQFAWFGGTVVGPVATTGRFWVILVGGGLSVVLSFHPLRRYRGSLWCWCSVTRRPHHVLALFQERSHWTAGVVRQTRSCCDKGIKEIMFQFNLILSNYNDLVI